MVPLSPKVLDPELPTASPLDPAVLLQEAGISQNAGSLQEWGQECQTVGGPQGLSLQEILRVGVLFTRGYPSRGKRETLESLFLS